MSDHITKKVIQNNYMDLLRDLELTATLNAKLIHYGLFNEDMLDNIMAEKTRKSRVKEMLGKLPRRGPRALEMFERAIQDDYPWLAEKLRRTHHQLHNFHKDLEEMSLKKRVDMRVHEKFGNSKRLSEEDKKEMRTFLYYELSRTTTHKHDSDEEEMMDHCDASDEHHQQDTLAPTQANTDQNALRRIYRILSHNPTEHDEVDGGDNSLPSDINMAMIEEQAEQLSQKLTKLQNEVNQCYTLFGVDSSNPDKPLTEIVQQSKEELDQLRSVQEDLERIQSQRDNLELLLEKTKDELQKKICRLTHLAKENENGQAKIKEWKEKCERIEAIHMKQLEKQEILYHLKEMVRDLSPVRKSMTALHQNMNNDATTDFYKSPSRKSKSTKLPKIKTPSSSTYQSPLGMKPINHHHHHHHHHYTDTTVASREHATYPNRHSSREQILAPILKLPR